MVGVIDASLFLVSIFTDESVVLGVTGVCVIDMAVDRSAD